MSTVRLLPGDCIKLMRAMSAASIDAIVTDTPYGLGFMGKDWDSPGGVGDFPMRRADAINTVNTGVTRQGGRQRSCEDFTKRQLRDARSYGEWCREWASEAYRVLKPGAHLVAFGGTRTYHRLVCAIEDAGFEIRDTIAWLYGTGFPKSHDVSKAIDKSLGAQREKVKPRSIIGHQRNIGNHRPWMDDPEHLTNSDRPESAAAAAAWAGFGTSLKPAFEPIVLARKPLIGTVAENVLQHGTGAINIDGGRIECIDKTPFPVGSTSADGSIKTGLHSKPRGGDENETGRWPANVAHDDSDEVLAAFPDSAGQLYDRPQLPKKINGIYGDLPALARGDTGSAARFFFSAKADSEDRWGSKHPTVKPVALIRWLMRLVTPPSGTVLDPFAGSGTAGVAALAEGFDAVLIEREPEYIADIEARLAYYRGEGGHSLAQKNRSKRQSPGTLL
jgi:DNA modification methylase